MILKAGNSHNRYVIYKMGMRKIIQIDGFSICVFTCKCKVENSYSRQILTKHLVLHIILFNYLECAINYQMINVIFYLLYKKVPKSSYTTDRHLFSLLLLIYLEFSLIVFWTEKQGSAASVDVNAHLIFSGAHKFSNMKKTTLHKKYEEYREMAYVTIPCILLNTHRMSEFFQIIIVFGSKKGKQWQY